MRLVGSEQASEVLEAQHEDRVRRQDLDKVDPEPPVEPFEPLVPPSLSHHFCESQVCAALFEAVILVLVRQLHVVLLP